MMPKAYVDTNIFDYVALKNITYGKACKEILDDIGTFLEGNCSLLVPVEILGSLSEISSKTAFKTLAGFFSFKLNLIEVNEELILNASKMAQKDKINGYDAVHVAAMKKVKIKTLITENYDDFKKVKSIEIVRPLDYQKWKSLHIKNRKTKQLHEFVKRQEITR